MAIYGTDEGEPEHRGVFAVHEEHLDKTAGTAAKEWKYDDQKQVILNRIPKAAPSVPNQVFIVIDPQFNYGEWEDAVKQAKGEELLESWLHYKPNSARRYDGFSWPKRVGELGDHVRIDDPKELKKKGEGEARILPSGGAGLDKQRLIACSGLAYDHFTYKPLETELHLPVRYPRKHVNSGEKGRSHYDEQVEIQRAHILPDPLEKIIIPWLQDDDNFPEKKRPRGIPLREDLSLFDMIHLYNAMQQLAMPRFLQRPLIERLCKTLYCTRLSKCELDTLEATVAHFSKNSVAVLDPVICCLVGSYGLRERDDRNPRRSHRGEADDDDDDDDDGGDTRGYFEYTSRNPERILPDTVIVPPRLPVLGHTIRHYSGVRDTGDSRAAHVGYPLHIGKSAYYNQIDRPSKERAKQEHYVPEVWHDTYELGELRRLPSFDLLHPLAMLKNLPGQPAEVIEEV